MKMTLDIPESRIASLLCSAVEDGSYGSGYWARTTAPYKMSKAGFMALVLPFAVTDIEADEPGKTYIVTKAKLQKALGLMAQGSPHAFGQFLAEADDATTGDIFLQYAVFGELLYG